MSTTPEIHMPTPDVHRLLRQALLDLRQARAEGDEIGTVRAEREMNSLLELLPAQAA
ncbi:MAG TPA: hypothetical protein VJT49_01620 [Amycolatopsis sp.]|uniref:hypothetical protein n=1 Tax=Amycolatopsis sp. TaxID=37632 RepID=UPI002B4836F9|nr:hypothetical protein [Amycolatopsis sp.]HKS43811.1 hypothetical protein [Amycolatopsis sp.]